MYNFFLAFSRTLALAVLSLLFISDLSNGNSLNQNQSYILGPEYGTAGLESVRVDASFAIATTILRPGPILPVWLDYHLRWVHHVVIFMDDPDERPLFESLCGNRPVTLLDGSQVESRMTPESRLIRRQMANMRHAITYLMERGYTWLIHIDLDELLFGPLVESRSWASDLEIGLVTFSNHEALPVDFETSNPFKDCVYFWVNGVDRNANFAAYGNGKSAVRLGPGVKPKGPHAFSGYTGRIFTPSDEEAMVLHYPYPSYNSWLLKFNHYGRFPDHWFGDRRGPKIIDFMLQSRDVVQMAHKTNDWVSAKAFFSKRILDTNSRKEAINQGKIRQYTPFAES
ncbi:hypothetical protein N7462_003496 [Penicillium macrosclerotiorum]|uniref:uncharacterized protein n=1 Tax=Penicillium macrosclerotiorum TaxID=303699 RepID=UPI00254948DB|nr:uncharacterized protein N7462_003496 [Penicillium macrosclerotiorum]KAJ5689104.1 hypothetical protein N7462_003496 [Penicillium macrosclerotiorum]